MFICIDSATRKTYINSRHIICVEVVENETGEEDSIIYTTHLQTTVTADQARKVIECLKAENNLFVVS